MKLVSGGNMPFCSFLRYSDASFEELEERRLWVHIWKMSNPVQNGSSSISYKSLSIPEECRSILDTMSPTVPTFTFRDWGALLPGTSYAKGVKPFSHPPALLKARQEEIKPGCSERRGEG